MNVKTNIRGGPHWSIGGLNQGGSENFWKSSGSALAEVCVPRVFLFNILCPQYLWIKG